MSVLCYHTVDPTWRSGLSMDPTVFRAHCAWLARHRKVVDLDTAVTLMDRRGKLPRGVSCLTFDDGLAGLYEHALPALRAYRLPATVFVVARTLSDERKVDWIDDPPAHQLVTLTIDQLREMKDSGVEVASHSHAHHVLPELPREACEQDLRISRELLEETFGTPVRHLAYPRGRHDEGVREAARRAGYRHAFGLPVGPEPTGPFSLPRVGIYRHNSVTTMRAKSMPGYLSVRNRLTPMAVEAVQRLSGQRSAARGRESPMERPRDRVTGETPRCAS